MSKKKLGCVIIMRPNHNNYGTSLQGFATIQFLKQHKIEFEVIRYLKKRSLIQIVSILPLYLLSGGAAELIRLFKNKLILKQQKGYFQNLRLRSQAVNQFKVKYLEPFCKYYNGYRDLVNGAENYGVIMVGSDQVWTPMSLYSKFYNLLFVKTSIPTFSYASSFGVSKIPFYQLKETKGYLEKLNLIGVREVQGKNIVESLTKKSAQVVLDPTMLLSQSEWSNLIPLNAKGFNQPYIFCYILGNSKETRKAINTLKMKTGLKVVYLRHIDVYNADDEHMGDFSPYDVSPLDFVNLIRNATYVCTDSFHGTVFSIIFQKKFTVFYRHKQNSSQSTNSRIDNLVDMFNLRDRFYNGDILSIENEIDYNSIIRQVDEERKKSIAFFMSGINLEQ